MRQKSKASGQKQSKYLLRAKKEQKSRANRMIKKSGTNKIDSFVNESKINPEKMHNLHGTECKC